MNAGNEPTEAGRLIEEQNRRAGRVIPRWLYYVAFFVTFTLGEMGSLVDSKFGFWPFVGVVFVAAVVWLLLMGRYVKRVIR